MTRKLRGTQLVTLIYLYIVMVVVLLVEVVVVVVLEVFAATLKMTSHLVLLDAIKA